MPTTTASEDKEAGEGDFADDDPLGDAVMEEDDEEVEDLYDNDGVSENSDRAGRHGGAGDERRTLSSSSMAEGYFNAFFEEDCKLGAGANGSVFLCQVSPYGLHCFKNR